MALLSMIRVTLTLPLPVSGTSVPVHLLPMLKIMNAVFWVRNLLVPLNNDRSIEVMA